MAESGSSTSVLALWPKATSRLVTPGSSQEASRTIAMPGEDPGAASASTNASTISAIAVTSRRWLAFNATQWAAFSDVYAMAGSSSN